MDAESKTLINVGVDNQNRIRTYVDFDSVDSEEVLRIIHSFLQEFSLDIIDKIYELKSGNQ